VLLLNSDLNFKEFIANKFAMKCDESFTDKAALRQITKALNDRKKCNCQPYKHFIMDFSGQQSNVLMLKDLVPKIRKTYKTHPKAD
jgi:hypothetical protein